MMSRYGGYKPNMVESCTHRPYYSTMQPGRHNDLANLKERFKSLEQDYDALISTKYTEQSVLTHNMETHIDFHAGFIHVPRAKIGRVTPVPVKPFFYFRRVTLNPAIYGSVIDTDTAHSQHLLQLPTAGAIFAVPAYRLQDYFTLKMPVLNTFMNTVTG